MRGGGTGEVRNDHVERAFRTACHIEMQALKPGNVHVHAPGAGMTVADFEASCDASAPPLTAPGLSVGRRILAAVRATQRSVGCNTNLGIILLAAPLAHAALSDGASDLRVRLQAVLDDLDIRDAVAAFEAIRLAAPGGLGDSTMQDVRDTPTVSLREAMAIAAARDLVARQYANGYAEIFDEGVPTLRRARRRWKDAAWAAAATYLCFLARYPDSHVSRKFGAASAEALRRQAEPFFARLVRAEDPTTMRPDLAVFDRDLKDRGLNPGTSADLCVASLFADALERDRK